MATCKDCLFSDVCVDRYVCGDSAIGGNKV